MDDFRNDPVRNLAPDLEAELSGEEFDVGSMSGFMPREDDEAASAQARLAQRGEEFRELHEQVRGSTVSFLYRILCTTTQQVCSQGVQGLLHERNACLRLRMRRSRSTAGRHQPTLELMPKF